MPTIHNVPGCCTALMMVGLGPTDTAGIRARTANAQNDNTVDGLVVGINQHIENARHNGFAILMATTTNQQLAGIEALRRCGFAHSKWAEKTRHPETRVRLWYKRLNPNGV